MKHTELRASSRLRLVAALALSAATVVGVGAPSGAGAGETPASVLYVQDASAGTLTPVEGVTDTFDLVLTGVDPRTVWFTDRPDRRADTVPTGASLKAIGFGPKTGPPNAVLTVPEAADQHDAVAVTLTRPEYDAETATLRYRAKLLPRVRGTGLEDYADQLDRGVPETFGTAVLFVDDGTEPDPNSSPQCEVTVANHLSDASLSLTSYTVLPDSRSWTYADDFFINGAPLQAGRAASANMGDPTMSTCGATMAGVILDPQGSPTPYAFSAAMKDPFTGSSDWSCEAHRTSGAPAPDPNEAAIVKCAASGNAWGQPLKVLVVISASQP